ncbi:hypothetical protein L915_02461 [Phytophthora nicotianae]|uniref:Uncharacterized protein n=1 Tax=Phytophthora nicotianae TaxID=4792 RepID=W2JQ69_PHYNI|nr:hypothetical protein L915_02461 [Phytophthora nicotianae]ETL47882.1 hypothetical protein L916_02434 [Phytophthora nicotianae]
MDRQRRSTPQTATENMKTMWTTAFHWSSLRRKRH